MAVNLRGLHRRHSKISIYIQYWLHLLVDLFKEERGKLLMLTWNKECFAISPLTIIE